MSAQPVEAVIFDYGGVISVPVFHDLAPIERELGLPPGSIHRLMFEADPASPDAEPDFHKLETGTMTFAEYLDRLVERAPRVLGRPIDAEVYAQFSSARPLQIQWPVVHRIRALRDEGVGLALLTNNAKEFAGSWRASFPVEDLFPVVVDSSEVGLRKPNPEIFELTCELVGVEPTAAVFLDDNVDNVTAARALGIETVLVSPDCTATITELDLILERRGTRPR